MVLQVLKLEIVVDDSHYTRDIDSSSRLRPPRPPGRRCRRRARRRPGFTLGSRHSRQRRPGPEGTIPICVCNLFYWLSGACGVSPVMGETSKCPL